MRLVLHTGFHKTGTTSLQQTLRKNKRLLSRHWRVFTRLGQEPLCEAARAYSVRSEPLERALLAHEWALFLNGLDAEDARPVVFSSADLAGHMPGRHGLRRYDLGPILEVLLEGLPEGARLDLALSLREREGWLASAWAQHVRATRFTQDFAAFSAELGPETDLARDAAEAAKVLGTRGECFTWASEACRSEPLGTLGPLLEFAEFPKRLWERIEPVRDANPRLPKEALEELLAINRSDLSKADWKEAKRAVIEGEP